MTRSLRLAAIPVFLLLVRLLACSKSNSSPTAPGVAMTPTMPAVGATATPPAAATPTPPPAAHTVAVGPSGSLSFRDSVSGGSTTTIHVGETVTWNWGSGPHSTTSGTCCTASGMWDSGVKSSGSFSQMFSSAGTFPYFCTVHGASMTGTVMVTP